MKFYITIFLILAVTFSFAQNQLYIPRNISKAYEKGTRSLTGEPGNNYWQNSSDYKIKINIDPYSRVLSGSETITYYNNSPDTLKYFYMRLYQNVNKIGNARDFQLRKEAVTEGVEIKEFSINSINIDISNRKIFNIIGTNLIVKPDQPVTPRSSVQITTEWSCTVPPISPIRTGLYDSLTYLIAYWYPQMSVYDDIDGWDTFEYGGQQEFYNDFSNYDVEINVPNNFGVWATGVLQNSEELLTEKYLSRFNDAHESDTVINIITKEDYASGKIFNNINPMNTWRYKAVNVTDFVFALSDHYLWDAVNYNIDNRNVFVSAVYKETSLDFYKVAWLSKECIKYFSTEMPGIPFPYPSLTVFNGGGGMEYPMFVNDGSVKEWAGTVGVTSHEIAHTYFPFYMGTNERKYAFMDEGMAVMLPFKFQEQAAENNFPRARNSESYEKVAGTEEDFPLILPSTQLRSAYRTSAYTRPGLAYYFLKDVLGDEIFIKAMHEYIRTWNGKHPIPNDFFYIFDKAVDKDLSWFWRPWFYEQGYPDLAVKDVKIENNSIHILIEKKGNIPIPVKLIITNTSGNQYNLYKNASIWENGDKESWLEYKNIDNFISIELGDPAIPDSDRSNNFYPNK